MLTSFLISAISGFFLYMFIVKIFESKAERNFILLKEEVSDESISEINTQKAFPSEFKEAFNKLTINDQRLVATIICVTHGYFSAQSRSVLYQITHILMIEMLTSVIKYILKNIDVIIAGSDEPVNFSAFLKEYVLQKETI